MEIHIKKLTKEDLPLVEEMAKQKFNDIDMDSVIFNDSYNDPIFKYFMLDDKIYGSELYSSHGYFINNKLVGVIGARGISGEPAWILSYIVTSQECSGTINIIKCLLNKSVEYYEARGYFQWYVVSKLSKFKAWQKLFKEARTDYHHYVYARTPANTLPEWRSALLLSSNKLFPYDTNISMYISKKICTTDDMGKTKSIDESILKNEYSRQIRTD